MKRSAGLKANFCTWDSVPTCAKHASHPGAWKARFVEICSRLRALDTWQRRKDSEGSSSTYTHHPHTFEHFLYLFAYLGFLGFHAQRFLHLLQPVQMATP